MAEQRQAGQPVQPADYINLAKIEEAYFHNVPDMANPVQQVRFGTSGHRGTAEKGSFTECHVAAIVQAVCEYRSEFGAIGPMFLGQDTHGLSQLAFRTAIEVLAGNGVVTYIDKDGGFVPTPSISRAIVRYNGTCQNRWSDGIVITPSHNPPEHGGIKYNDCQGGPADKTVTTTIEQRANEILRNDGIAIKRIPYNEAVALPIIKPYDFMGQYVLELAKVVDLESIRNSGLRIMVDALGGSGMHYWNEISRQYEIPMVIINDTYDPQFRFMNYDGDGKVRMDCSSPYVMSSVTKQAGDYDLIVANDPDYDRFGIVCGTDGMLGANQFLSAGAHYLLTHRKFSGRGIGKTAVTTNMLRLIAADLNVPLYEVPVGFKFFGPLFMEHKIAFAGEESAGASFVQKDGSVWTTDKDGMILALLAMELTAVTGKRPNQYYDCLCEKYGTPYAARTEAEANLEERNKISELSVADVEAEVLGGSAITAISSTSEYGDMPLGGVKITTASGWVVARPSGTEDLYKLYSESFESTAVAQKLLAEGKLLIAKALSK